MPAAPDDRPEPPRTTRQRRSRAPSRPGPWLRHIEPVPEVPGMSDMWEDTVRLRIEEQVSATIPLLIAAGVPRAEAAATAANYVFRQALAMQRDAAPRGQEAMLAALLEGDPNMAGIRRGLYDELRKRTGRAFLLGWGCGLLGWALGRALVG